MRGERPRREGGRGRPFPEQRGLGPRVSHAPPDKSRDFPLPKPTRQVLKGGLPGPEVEANPSLLLNKLVGPWQAGPRLGAQERRRLLERCARWPSAPLWESLRQNALLRWKEALKSYGKQGWTVRTLKARPVWRFVSGLGASSPLEVNLVLHPILGFPYIPGSSIKGVVRAYAEQVLEQEPKRPDAPASEIHPEIARIFGARDRQGAVVFFDALPETPPKLELDVINVHYPAYYRGSGPPSEWQDPNPVFFLTVGRETVFLFALASKDSGVADKALEWLKGALKEGLGGKTRAGYGEFEEVSP